MYWEPESSKSPSMDIALSEVCLACSGTGVLGEHSTAALHDCPWCQGRGASHGEVNLAFTRVKKKLPKLCHMCDTFGNGHVVLKMKERVA